MRNEDLCEVLPCQTCFSPVATTCSFLYSTLRSSRSVRHLIFSFSCNLFMSFRLKRDSSKMSTADMLALLAMLETDDRNTNRPISGNDDADLALYYRNRMMQGNTDQLQDEPSDGEWWNDLIEPSVQYYGNPYGHIEQNARDRHQFPAKRYMISKKKRSLAIHKPDHFFDGPLKSKVSSGFDSRYSASQRY